MAGTEGSGKGDGASAEEGRVREATAPPRKVMIYLPERLYRDVKRRAVDEGRSASDLYADAAAAYLAAPPVPSDGGRGSSDRAGVTIDLVIEAIDRHDRRIDELFARLDDARARPTTSDVSPGAAGTKLAEAMGVVLGILREAGADGVGSKEMLAATYGKGVTSGAAETAKAVLRDAGLVRYRARRWSLAPNGSGD